MTMVDQENCMRVTRLAKKRAAAAATADDQQQPVNKKRAILGELINVSNVGASVNPNLNKPQQQRAKRKVKAKAKSAPVTDNTQLKEVPKEEEANAEIDAVLDYLQKLEADPKRRPLPDYMERIQNDVNSHMRGVLVDWLVEVAEEYKLQSDTLYLTVTYIDNFLSLNPLNREKLQLLGVSSMLIASKYEEISPPNVENFCYITDNSYTKEEVVKMDADILKSLNFELGYPTITIFLRQFTPTSQEEYRNHAMQQYTHYESPDLKECVLILHDSYLSRRGAGLQAMREKYKQPKFECVANMPSPPEIPIAYFEEAI